MINNYLNLKLRHFKQSNILNLIIRNPLQIKTLIRENLLNKNILILIIKILVIKILKMNKSNQDLFERNR